MSFQITEEIRWACSVMLRSVPYYTKLDNTWYFILEETKREYLTSYAMPIKNFKLPQELSQKLTKDMSKDLTKAIIEIMKEMSETYKNCCFLDSDNFINIMLIPHEGKLGTGKSVHIDVHQYRIFQGDFRVFCFGVGGVWPSDPIPNDLKKIVMDDVSDIYRSPKTGLLYPPCTFCHSLSRTRRCGGCENAHYCNRECQKKDWKTHKVVCVFQKKDKKKRKRRTKRRTSLNR